MSSEYLHRESFPLSVSMSEAVNLNGDRAWHKLRPEEGEEERGFAVFERDDGEDEG